MDWPYKLSPQEKRSYFAAEMSRLTQLHYDGCNFYRSYVDKFGFKSGGFDSVAEVPFVPVRFFKEFDLLSVPEAEIVKKMTSSGTSGQPSRIFLDKVTALGQTRALSSIMAGYVGSKRLPMLVIDTPEVISSRNVFSARAAGVTGFSIFARDRVFALDANLELDVDILQDFLAKHSGQDFMIFGFTHLIYSQLVIGLRKFGSVIDLSNGILVHGGGWKKLEVLRVSDAEFKAELRQLTGLRRVHNYYGMVEQTGSIFVECEHGYMHASDYSEVIVRDPVTFSVLPKNEAGVLQLMSTLPLSYPGHSLLTEDVGEILSDDVCLCGRNGKSIKIHGRLERAEVRGCSDSYV
jgi:hypothetical protein